MREAAGPKTDEPKDPGVTGGIVRRTACKGALGKGMQKFVGRSAPGDAAVQAPWAPMFLPSAGPGMQPHPRAEETTTLRKLAWGQGDPKEATKELR